MKDLSFKTEGLATSAEQWKVANWPGTAKGMPPMPLPIVLLGRLAVADDWQGRGIASLLLAAAREIASASMHGAGGVGMAVDPAD